MQEIINEIISAGRFLDQKGLCPATTGNISIRLDDSTAAITVSGKHKGQLTPDDIIVVDKNGRPVGTDKVPSAETLLHTSLYTLKSDVQAVIHNHSLNGTILAQVTKGPIITKGYEIHKVFPGITTHESELCIPIFENSQDMPTLSALVSDYLKEHPNVFGYFLRGHGIYAWGKTMHEAKIRIEAFEFLFACELAVKSFHSMHQPLANSKKPKAVLIDIEGTVSSLSFVRDVLFPYAKKNMETFVKANLHDHEVSQAIQQVREIEKIPSPDLQKVLDVLAQWMEQDKKATPLKALQGLLWEEGYQSGYFQTHFYSDAYDMLKKWKEQGIALYVFSSGSVHAQKLLFSHTPYGNIKPFFSGYFDTTIGNKREKASYDAIAKNIGSLPEEVLFLSDIAEELDAAQLAGMQTLHVCRDAIPDNQKHTIIQSFNQVACL